MKLSEPEMRADPAEKIPWARPCFWGREEAYVLEALRSSWISGGPFLESMENKLSQWAGRPAMAVANGTAAIHLPYLALDLKPGDEVVLPGFGFMAAANVALQMGLRPVFADVDPQTWSVTAESMARCLTPRTRLLVVIHTYGNVCAMDPILELARDRGLPVLEDAAEAFGCRYKGKLAGSMGDFGTLSFQATKTVTCGEGGAVWVANEAHRQRVALFRSHGMNRRRYFHEVPGHNFRLTNLQAALVCAQLEAWPEIVAQRQRLAADYRRELASLQGVTPQVFTPEVDPVVWAIAVILDPKAFPQGRDAVMEAMEAKGIETRPGFYAPGPQGLYGAWDLPVSDHLSGQVLSLPSFAHLTQEQIQRCCRTLSQCKR